MGNANCKGDLIGAVDTVKAEIQLHCWDGPGAMCCCNDWIGLRKGGYSEQCNRHLVCMMEKCGWGMWPVGARWVGVGSGWNAPWSLRKGPVDTYIVRQVEKPASGWVVQWMGGPVDVVDMRYGLGP